VQQRRRHREKHVISDKPILHVRRVWRVIRNKGLWLKFLFLRIFTSTEFHEFRCNICGNISFSPLALVRNRERISCYHCGSSKRFRSIVAALSDELFGKVVTLPEFEENGSVAGYGMSDSDIYAVPLSRKVSYTNTYYHKEPRLDITTIDRDIYNKADFVISSDVFEHVPPPIDAAFDNLFNLLKSNGVCIFSVPYTNSGVTKEHYPDLYEYRIVNKNGKPVLINTTRDGDRQQFDNLHFHGGGGATLEMRMFSKPSLLDHFKRAGFTTVKFYQNSIPEHGILLVENSPHLVISLRKP